MALIQVVPQIDVDKSDLRDAYQQALTNLDAVQNITTQGEALAAVKMLARNQTKILKVLRKLVV